MSDSFCQDSEQIQGESIRFCYQLVSGAQWVHRVAGKEKVIRYTSRLLYLNQKLIKNCKRTETKQKQLIPLSRLIVVRQYRSKWYQISKKRPSFQDGGRVIPTYLSHPLIDLNF